MVIPDRFFCRLLPVIICLCCPLYHYAQSGDEKAVFVSGSTYEIAMPKDSLQLQQLIDSCSRLNNKDSALTLLYRAHHASTEAGYQYGAGTALLFAGNIHLEQGDYETARDKLLQSIPILQQDPKGKQHVATAFYNIGLCLQSMGDIEGATSCFYKAVHTIANVPGSKLPVERIYSRLAEVLGRNRELALRYHDSAEAIIRQKNDQAALGILLLNRAKDYNRGQEFAAGDSCIMEALHIGRETKDSLLQYRTYMVLASSRLFQHKPQEALQYLETAGRLGVQEKDVFQQNANLFLWSEAYYQLKNYSLAEKYGQLILDRSRMSKLKEQEAHAHDMLAVSYAGMGLYKKAYEHHQLFKFLKDQVTNEKIAGNIQQLEKKYQGERKDRTIAEHKLLIAEQQQNITKKNILLTVAGITLGFLAMVSFFIYRSYKGRQRLALQQQEIGLLKAMMEGAEQERKRLAIELHDGIGGMLAAVKMKIGTMKRKTPAPEQMRDLDDVNEMLHDTGAEVRRTAHNLIPDILELHDLQYALLRYCNNIQDTGELNITLELNGDLHRLNKQTELIVYRLVQELVQNILKHAEAQQASVQVILFDNQLSITVEDNGKGFDPEAYQEGFGLRQIRYRVQSLGGSVEITSVPYKATLVNILFGTESLNLVA